MTTRLEDVPVVKIKTAIVDAEIYNRVRLGLIRLENPLRLSLPGLRGMDMVLDNHAWICVDRTLYDLPVLAWTRFKITHRNALHWPVQCQLNYYHVHANVIAETVLATTYRLLEDLLRNTPEATNKEVFPLYNATRR